MILSPSSSAVMLTTTTTAVALSKETAVAAAKTFLAQTKQRVGGWGDLLIWRTRTGRVYYKRICEDAPAGERGGKDTFCSENCVVEQRFGYPTTHPFSSIFPPFPHLVNGNSLQGRMDYGGLPLPAPPPPPLLSLSLLLHRKERLRSGGAVPYVRQLKKKNNFALFPTDAFSPPAGRKSLFRNFLLPLIPTFPLPLPLTLRMRWKEEEGVCCWVALEEGGGGGTAAVPVYTVV